MKTFIKILVVIAIFLIYILSISDSFSQTVISSVPISISVKSGVSAVISNEYNVNNNYNESNAELLVNSNPGRTIVVSFTKYYIYKINNILRNNISGGEKKENNVICDNNKTGKVNISLNEFSESFSKQSKDNNFNSLLININY
jgi:hypothetical protein